MPMHADRDTFIANPSVCPSGIVSKRVHISTKLFPPSGRGIFGSAIAVTKFKGNSLSGGVKYTGVGEICDFRQISPFKSETVRTRQAHGY